MTKQIKKSDCEAEIKRLNYILENFKCSAKEVKQITGYIKSAQKLRDQLATKKESKECNI